MNKTYAEKLLALATNCADTIQQRLAEVQQLELEMKNLNGNTCTGREYWRDKDHEKKPPKLYILHSIDQACPLHGKPESGERLRTYIGSDPVNITEAMTAMDNEHVREKLQNKLGQIESRLSSSYHTLRRFYDNLDYDVADDGTIQPRR